MLSIGKLGKGQERYYLDKVAEGAEDYYSGEGEAAGEWLGDAAEGLGLEGEVEAAQLEAMLSGRNPADGEPLLGTQAASRPRAASPASTSPSRLQSPSPCSGGSAGPSPPSKSGRPPRSRRSRPRLHAARGVLDSARRRRLGVRQGQRLPRRRLRPSLLAKRRPPAPHPRPDRQRDQGTGRPLDPPLPPGDLRPREDRRLHLRGPPAPRADRRLGVEWQPVRNGIAEIAGFADEHLRAFSTRRAEILEVAGEDASARSMQVATLATRKPKERDVRRRGAAGALAVPGRGDWPGPRGDRADLRPGGRAGLAAPP